MRTSIKSTLIFLSIIHFGFSQGPGTAAVPFLQIGPSPALGSYQAASAVIPTDDSFGFYYNPAQLGVFSRQNNFAMQIYTEKVQWLPQFNFDDLTFSSYSFAGGYVVQDFCNELDLNIGIGYMRTVLDLGRSIMTDTEGNELGVFSSSENYDAYSVGFGFQYYAYFSFGYTYKKINSNLAPAGIIVGTETTDGRADASAHDVGFLVSLPLISEDDDYSFERMRFFSNAYFGYAISNIGDFVKYDKNRLGDPLPKTEHLGIGFSLGLIETYGSHDVKMVELELANEANDLLIENRSYQPIFKSDTDLIDNVLLGNSDDLVRIQNSLKVNLLESIHLGFHRMKGPGFPRYVHNTSFMISTSGILKVFAQEWYEDFGQFFDIRYSQCDIDAGSESPLDETKYQSVSIHLKNILNLDFDE